MLYKRSREQRLDRELFKNPGKEYRGAPFWSLNCRLEKKDADFQLGVFDEMGMGGVNLHPRTGLETPYMGEEFLDFIRHAVEEGKKRGMYSWLYDEDRYPSGAAGGMVTENLNYRARYLLLTENPQKKTSEEKTSKAKISEAIEAGLDFCDTREQFEQRIAAGEKPRGYYVTSYEIILENGYLKEYHRVERGAVSERGRVRDAYVCLAKESPWYNDQTYVDTLNREAIKRFIEVTHEKYAQAVGDEFGKWIPAIFTDEPQMAGKYSLKFADSHEDATIAYTDDLDSSFQACCGVSLLDILPEILWELPRGQVSAHRYRYHDHVAERFVQAFSDTLSDWCGNHNLALTGHYMSERTLFSQTLALGEAMRCYRNMQIPGIDNLCDAKEFTTAKQAVSAARQNGREAVLSEIYGATHWDFDFIRHKLQGDWQAALGITVRVHHLAYLSMAGEAKRDWPASIGFQSPWHTKYSYIEDHFARVNTVLTRGKAKIRLGVIHPIESFWIAYGPNDQTQAVRDRLDRRFTGLTEWLEYGLIDFDFISESMLPKLCPDAGYPLSVGNMEYQTVLVPSMHTIRSTTLERLERFAEYGGKVIFAGEIPALVDAVPSLRAQQLAGKCLVTEFEQTSILDSLGDIRDVEIVTLDGHPAENLVYQMREDGREQWIFLCHVNRGSGKADQCRQNQIRLRGSWKLELYDTLTGEIYPLQSSSKNGWTIINWDAYGQDSLLIHMVPVYMVPVHMIPETADGRRDGECERLSVIHLSPAVNMNSCRTIKMPDAVRFSEPNVLLIDQASWSLNGEAPSDTMPILEIDNELRRRLGYPRRQDAYTQPWRIPDQKEIRDRVTLQYEFFSEAELTDVYLAAENPEAMEIYLNGKCITRRDITEDLEGKEGLVGKEDLDGKENPDGWYVDPCIRKIRLPGIQKGKNLFTVSMPFGRKTNLEWMYLLGEFQVELRGTRSILREKQEVGFGDLTRQGMPFYTGNTTYEASIRTEKRGNYVLEVPQHAAAVMDVCIDGKDRGTLCFAPYRISLGELNAGEHKLEITAYGNRFNGFGTLHNADSDYKWYGPDSYRTYHGQWTDSYLVKPMGITSSLYIYEGE